MNQRKNKPFILRRPFKYSFHWITLFIIVINCLIYSLAYLNKDWYILALNYGALNVRAVEEGHAWWQFITYMFLHQNFSHILFNMLGLLIFGFNVEKVLGSKEFVLMYFVCGILSGFFSYLVYKFTGQYYVYLLGASGAVYSILFAYAVLFPRSIIYIWGLIPLPAPVMVLVYALIEIGSQFFGNSNVAHMTHLFGFFAAWLYFVVRMGIHPVKIWKNTYGH